MSLPLKELGLSAGKSASDTCDLLGWHPLACEAFNGCLLVAPWIENTASRAIVSGVDPVCLE
jgi:hypothetical protein